MVCGEGEERARGGRVGGRMGRRPPDRPTCKSDYPDWHENRKECHIIERNKTHRGGKKAQAACVKATEDGIFVTATCTMSHILTRT